jgi:hypothetical protein
MASSAHFSLSSVSVGFFLGLLFNFEDGGDMVLQNIRLPLKCTQKTHSFLVTAGRNSYPTWYYCLPYFYCCFSCKMHCDFGPFLGTDLSWEPRNSSLFAVKQIKLKVACLQL